MPFQIVRNDIVKMKVDAIVNATNTNLFIDGGVGGDIFRVAGPKLQKACDVIAHCDVGKAVITDGFNLDAKYVIHTVGPIWQDGSHNEEDLLYSAYKNSLNLAKDNNVASIAFPLISAGIYGFPKDQALLIANKAITNFLKHNEMDIYLLVYGQDSVLMSEKLFDEITHYIDDNYIADKMHSFDISIQEASVYNNKEYLSRSQKIKRKKRNLKDIISAKEDTFSEMLLRLIDQKELTDVQVYKNANIDRRLFSKIRSDKDYSPSKNTAIAFAISLNLNLDETYDLLKRAGYTLSPSSKFDIIVQFFIENESYNIYDINEALFSFDESLLGAWLSLSKRPKHLSFLINLN